MRSVWTRATNAPLYPVLLASTIVVATLLDVDVNVHAAIRPFLLVVAIAAAATGLLVLTLGRVWGPLVAAGLVLLVRSGSITYALLGVLLIGLVASAWVLARRIRGGRLPLDRATRPFNGLAALLLLATVLNSAANGQLWRLEFGHGADRLDIGSPGEGRLPDVYVVILDGYPRADTLARLFDHDNSAFLEALEREGFAVSAGASSNYMYTSTTFASMLHMSYLDELNIRHEISTPSGISLRTLINDNPVWDAFRERGYQVAAIQPPWEHVAMRSADVFCGEALNEFELHMIRSTLIADGVRVVNPDFEADVHRDNVEQAFHCLEELSHQSGGPKLVFTHVGSPHLPIVFDASGEPADSRYFGHTAHEIDISRSEYSAAYRGQVEYLNGRVLEAVERLGSRGDQPVVLVMSDHGSESQFNWADARQSDIAERMSILFAAKTPGKSGLFPCDVTPVTVMATLMNAYLGTGLRTPAARHFVSTAQDKLAVIEATDPDVRAGLRCP